MDFRIQKLVSLPIVAVISPLQLVFVYGNTMQTFRNEPQTFWRNWNVFRWLESYPTLNTAAAVCSYAADFDYNSDSILTYSPSCINVSIQVLFTLVLHFIKKKGRKKKEKSRLHNFRIVFINNDDLGWPYFWFEKCACHTVE